jgi:GT2 family glycosyltransferase/glycosyltransferase involved in cell wall biosynthesis
MARLRSGAAGAEALFRAVLAEYDVRAAWIGLASALLAAGDPPGAADALQAALSRHVGLIDSGLAALADHISASLGAPGWCGLQSGGVFSASVPRPTLSIDGRPLRLDRKKRLPPIWRHADRLEVAYQGRPLLGSPIALERLRTVQGFVEGSADSISGWAWLPADPESAPSLQVGTQHALATDEIGQVPQGLAPLARPRSFSLPARMTGAALVHIRGSDGRDLLGSPLCRKPKALAPAQPPAAKPRIRPGKVTVLVPVYGSPARTLACLASVLRGLPKWATVLVIDDASPQPELRTALEGLAADRKVRLLRNVANLGFPQTVNRGLAEAVGDVVLLNSDTLVPLGWLERLRDAAWSAADIGTVTPFSNDATIMSYPSLAGDNKVPDQAETDRLDTLAIKANGTRVAPIPTAVGFCMYIRRDCLNAVGKLRADVFAQGYGEENDFCMRAHAAGWMNMAATGVFVAHVGGSSFGAARAHLLRRNQEILNRLHPHYAALVARHVASDKLRVARRRMDVLRWPKPSGHCVLLITHDMGGGVQRFVEARIDALVGAGIRPIVLRPVLNEPGWCRVDDGYDQSFCNLRFQLPREGKGLRRFLARQAPVRAELHHLVGHAPEIWDLCAELRLPFEVYLHDYAWFCARISLIGPQRRYCGEPGLPGCDECVAAAGSNVEEGLSPAGLWHRSARLLAKAARVIAPSADAANRIRRHFPNVKLAVSPWEGAPRPVASRGTSSSVCRVCVVGGIGIEKGFDVLLACAQDAAARGLSLEFVVVGYTIDDASLHATGRVFVTGVFKPEEMPDLIVRQGANLGFLPSIWPETWCFAMSEMWRANLNVVAFDIGAQAERIRSAGRGQLLPLGLPPARVNDFLQGQIRGADKTRIVEKALYES